METVFAPITTLDALEQVVAQSWADPVVQKIDAASLSFWSAKNNTATVK